MLSSPSSVEVILVHCGQELSPDTRSRKRPRPLLVGRVVVLLPLAIVRLEASRNFQARSTNRGLRFEIVSAALFASTNNKMASATS